MVGQKTIGQKLIVQKNDWSKPDRCSRCSPCWCCLRMFRPAAQSFRLSGFPEKVVADCKNTMPQLLIEVKAFGVGSFLKEIK